MTKYLLFLGIGMLCSCFAYSQDFSNKGKEFWLVFPAHTPSSGQAQMGLFLTSDQNSSGTISVNGFNTTFTVTANQVTGPIDIPYASANVGTTNTVVNKGIHVLVNPGQKPVVLYAHIYAGFRSEASLILPVNTLGKDYYSTNFYQRSTAGSQSQFNIVATEAGTVVQYQLRINGVLSPTVNTVALPNPGDEIQVQNTQDLTGSVINSIASGLGGCKKIAVFSGSSALAIGSASCANPGSYDPLFQQCYPVSTWGKNFGVVPFLDNTNGYHVRVMAAEDNTTVNFNGTTVVLNAGQFYPASNISPTAFTAPLTISADKSISVSQYLMSANCAGSANVPGQTNAQGDPDMIILNPVEQNISDINIFSSNLQNIRTKYLNVYMKTVGSNTFTINGTPPIGSFVAMPQANGYSYLQEDLTNYASTSFRLKADSGFNAITYGMGDAESYGYSAGTNVKDLYQQISVSTQYGIETSPSVCSNSPFRFKISLPYKPLQLTWDISGLPAGTNPNTNPTTQLPTPATCTTFTIPSDASSYVCPDSITTVNGVPIYWYSIPTYYSIPTIGSYPIHLVAQTSNTDGCGTEQDIDFDLNVSDPPVADFNYTQPGCVAQTVQFNDASVTVKPNYHWYWDFGDPGSGAANNTSSLQFPTHLFSTPGAHVVRFSSITTPGCLSDTITKTVTVPAQPVATIAGTLAVCQNATAPSVTITGANGTSPYIFSYHINGGPIIQTAPGATATITAPTGTTGTYIYTLDSVKNATGSALCNTHVIGQSATITVNPLPSATISGTATVCQNSASPIITFTGSNGTPPYTFAYTLNGVAQTPVISPGVTSVKTITAPTTTPGIFTYALTSITDASLTVCSNTAAGSAVITVNQLPTATIAGTIELCLNAAAPNITFTGAGGVAPYTFTYQVNGGGNQTVTTVAGNSVTVSVPTSTAGTYMYTLISVKESSSTTCLNNQSGTATVTVDPQPTASFTYTTPDCAAKNITFTPSFSVSTGAVVSWIWDYGDGTGSHTRPDGNPFIIAYATAGTKVVTFKTVSDKGCTSALYTQNVVVSAKPVAGFISPQICLLDPFAQFNDTSHVATGQPGTITNWQWNFGDANATPGNPNTSTATNPTHVYTQVGPYTVQLIVTSSFGCKDTVNQNIFISDGNPQSNFIILNAANLCSNNSVAIQNKSTIASGNITKLEIYWDYLNQPAVFTSQIDPAFDQVFNHTYPTLTTAQNYTIHVRAYSGGVCYSSKDIIATVHAAPVAQLNAIPDVCLNNGTVQFTQGSETAGVPGTGVYSGAGVSASGLFNPITAGVGPHTITYTFTSNFGCVNFKTTTVKVLAAPVANFAPAAVTCQNNSITFTQSSTATAGTIVSWTWHWGDASPDETYPNGNPRSHTYTTAGSFTASLLVITDYGCKSIPKLVTFTVNPQPLPNFTFTPVACLPQAKIDFNNTTPNISDWGYQWTFDDINANSSNPNVSTAVSPPHTYTTVGPHNVLLVATSQFTHCTNSITIPVNSIHPAPTASFSMSKQTICTDQTLQLTDQSNPADGVMTDWAWDYNDNTGIAHGKIQPPHVYTDAGNYTLALTVTNSFGCTDDTSRPFIVYPYPVVDAGPDQTVLQDGLTYLQGTASGNQLVYLWTPSTYLGAVNILQPAVHPHEDITYKLTVTAQGGCAASDTVFIKVLKAPLIPNTFTPNNDGVHDKWEIKYLFQYPDNHVQVFTRTGQLVFESHGYTKPWDGTKGGKPLPFDTYYYVIEPGSGRAPITGYVTIIK